jgi:hypothetical protein
VDDARAGPIKHEGMRELAAAALLLLALVIGALAPKIWADETEGRTLASATPALSSAARALPSWRGRDGGAGFVVCGSSDTWRRPSVAEENAHLAADPRYRDQRVDDASVAARTFAASVLLYDGAGNSSRVGLATLSGLWADPEIGGRGCTSAEPQVWLFGYEPMAYSADGLLGGTLTVRAATGYRMVVLTAAPQGLAVVEGATTIGAFDLVKELPPRAATPKPVPTPTKAPAPNSPLVPMFPSADAPIGLTLPSTCATLSAGSHNDALGMTWRMQCGSAQANRDVAAAAIAQGWKLSDGNPPIGVGIQNYSKDGIWMQIAYRLDGPAFADPFVVMQTLRPGIATYDSTPHDFTLGAWCGIVDAPTRSADGLALKWLARCGNIAKAIVDGDDMNGRNGWKLTSVGTDPYAARRYCRLTSETVLQSGSDLGPGILAITQTDGGCR